MRIIEAGAGVLPIGRCGENYAVRVDFPVADWIETYGAGTFQLLVKRNGDVAPYPAVIEADEAHVFWDVTAADVRYPGSGRCELNYFVGDILAKSAVWITTVSRSLAGEDEEVPEAYEGWVNKVLEAANEAKSSADRAAEIEQESEDVLRQTKEALIPLTNRVAALETWAGTVPAAIETALAPVVERLSAVEENLTATMGGVSRLETRADETDTLTTDHTARITRLENHAVLDSGANE